MHRGAAAFLLPALVAAGLGALAARDPAPKASRHGTSAASRHPGASADSGVSGKPLADRLLARVGNGREITVSRFRDAWARIEPPERPDSLTPQSAREFLQLLIGKEALAEAALREPWVWTADESAGYLALRDHLVLRAALDSALDLERARIVAAGDTVPDEARLGVIARHDLIESLDLSFDEELLERLAGAFDAIPQPSRDSSLVAQLRVLGALPRLEPIVERERRGPLSDSLRAVLVDSLLSRPVAWGRNIRYTVSDLLEAWKRTNPLTRPRVRTAEQVRDLSGNGIFERELRSEADRQRLAERPDIARALAERREFIAVSHLVAREVYARIATDSLTLERHYRSRIDEWSLPLRVRLTRLVLADRAAALQMRLRLSSAAEAESLAERGARAGVNYRAVMSAEGDSALFARALAAGPGAVLGPDSVRAGWAVARVNEIVPGRRRTFAEARPLVHRAWYGEEGERLMEALLDRVRRRTRVTIDERALGGLSGAGGASGP